MATDYVNLTDTIDNLYERDDCKETLNTLNIIANLLWELGETRSTSAVYSRTIKHGKLTVTIDFKE
jgi:hypothetical protein